MKLKLSRYLHYLYLKNRLVARLKSLVAALSFRGHTRSRVVVTGAYFSENFGDFMMGSILKSAFESKGIATKLISYDQLHYSDSPDFLICGGGELGDEDYFKLVFQSVGTPENLRVLGLSPYAKLHESSAHILSKLKMVPFYSVRNKWAKNYLSELLNRNDIGYAPDIVFSLPKVLPETVTDKSDIQQENLVSINLIPYGMSFLKSGEVVLDKEHAQMLVGLYPELKCSVDDIAKKYFEYSRNLIEELLGRGKKVQVVSFSYGDYLFSKAFYSDLNINIVPFSKDPAFVLNTIGKSELFLTARFHSMIFGFLARTPILPFCYSMKCNNLLTDLFGENCHEFIDRNFLLTQNTEIHLHQLNLSPFSLSQKRLGELSSMAEQAIVSLIESIQRDTSDMR